MTASERLPDFLIIGAMKSGTTTLQAQLATQQGVFMTTPKEPNFFSDDAVFAKGAGWYHSLFADADPGDLKGEASTHYTKQPTYPNCLPRLCEMLKTPRLIYMIRDPVARAVSHYIHEWSEGRMDRDPALAFAQHTELVDYSRYAMQLAPYVEHFGREAIHLTSLEQMRADPEDTLRQIGQHIGAAHPLIWDHSLGAQNVSAERVRRLPFHGVLVDNPVAQVLRRSLVPKSVRTRIRKARTHGERPELSGQLRQKLEHIFLQDRAELAELFPGHPALSLCYGFHAT